jgi:hypothetical protein
MGFGQVTLGGRTACRGVPTAIQGRHPAVRCRHLAVHGRLVVEELLDRLGLAGHRLHRACHLLAEAADRLAGVRCPLRRCCEGCHGGSHLIDPHGSQR